MSLSSLTLPLGEEWTIYYGHFVLSDQHAREHHQAMLRLR